VLVGCSGVGRAYYYGLDADGSPTARIATDRSEHVRLLSGPDNRVRLVQGDFGLDVWVNPEVGWAWAIGPLYFPVVPVFPFLWPLRTAPGEEDLEIRFRILSSSGEVEFAPADFVVSLEDGTRLGPSRFIWGTSWRDESSAMSARQRVPADDVPTVHRAFLRYPTAGEAAGRFTLRVHGISDDGTEIDLPPVELRWAHGTAYETHGL